MKIYIRERPNSVLNEIFIIDRPNDFQKGDVWRFLNFKESGDCVITDRIFDRGQEIEMKPTMILDERATRELLQSFLELASEKGIEHDGESRAKGKLEATEKHLEDMRKLLKLK